MTIEQFKEHIHTRPHPEDHAYDLCQGHVHEIAEPQDDAISAVLPGPCEAPGCKELASVVLAPVRRG